MKIILEKEDITPALLQMLFSLDCEEPVKFAEPVVEQPKHVEQPEAPVAEIQAKGYTLDELKKAAAGLIASGKADIKALQQLNAEYKIRSLTELKPDMIDEYAANLKAMGANL